MGRMLVVDDDEVMRVLVQAMVTLIGYRATLAADADAAIETLQGQRFDAVITDLTMPGRDGFDVLVAAREKDPSCPVILMTASPSEEATTRALRLGAVACLTKPFTRDDIRHALGLALVQR